MANRDANSSQCSCLQELAHIYNDGTMVVVDNSRKMIGQNIDITVASVLQTTVGKMIFGRYNQES